MRASPNRRILYTAGAILAAESALFIGLTVRAHEHGIDLSQAKWPAILAVWFGPAAVLTALAWFIEPRPAPAPEVGFWARDWAKTREHWNLRRFRRLQDLTWLDIPIILGRLALNLAVLIIWGAAAWRLSGLLFSDSAQRMLVFCPLFAAVGRSMLVGGLWYQRRWASSNASRRRA